MGTFLICFKPKEIWVLPSLVLISWILEGFPSMFQCHGCMRAFPSWFIIRQPVSDFIPSLINRGRVMVSLEHRSIWTQKFWSCPIFALFSFLFLYCVFSLGKFSLLSSVTVIHHVRSNLHHTDGDNECDVDDYSDAIRGVLFNTTEMAIERAMLTTSVLSGGYYLLLQRWQ